MTPPARVVDHRVPREPSTRGLDEDFDRDVAQWLARIQRHAPSTDDGTAPAAPTPATSASPAPDAGPGRPAVTSPRPAPDAHGTPTARPALPRPTFARPTLPRPASPLPAALRPGGDPAGRKRAEDPPVPGAAAPSEHRPADREGRPGTTTQPAGGPSGGGLGGVPGGALGGWYGRHGRRRGSRVLAADPPTPLDRALWAMAVVQVTAVVLFALAVPWRPLVGITPETDTVLTALVLLATAAWCAQAARRERRRRGLLVGWSLLAAGHLGAVFTHHRMNGRFPEPGTFGLADWLVLCYFPLALAALWLMLREAMPRWLPSMWGDAVVVGLGTMAVGSLAADLLHPTTEGPATSVGALTPLADVVLLAIILSVAALTGSRLGVSAWWVAAGLILVAGSDLVHLILLATGRYRPGSVVDVGWLLGYTAIGVGARSRPWSPRRAWRRRPLPTSRASLHLGTLPWTFCAVSASVLVASALGVAVPPYSAVLALGSLCAALLRVGVTLTELDGGSLGGVQRTDELTGLANRRALSEALAAEPDGAGPDVRQWSAGTDRIALLLVDLDSFKDINEALGHALGDQVLAEVGARLRGALRSPQLIARLGGDEFAVVLPGAGRDSAVDVAESLCEVLAAPLNLDGHRLHVRASVGVATCLLPHDRPDDLLRQADVALNRAKAFGHRIEVYDPARDRRTAQRLQRIDELRSALERGDLEVFLQPQVNLVDGTVKGAEALARWRHPSDGVLLPDSFLPLAAQTGLMRPVAAMVLDRAVEACAQWWRRGHRIPVSVNLTADDLRDPDLSRQISESLTQHGLPPHALHIELTEGILLTDPEAAGRLMETWRRVGIAVAIDDFGTGYSSLGYLRDLPFDELKLDRSFVADLHRRRTVTIVRHTVAMAHGLGMHVVAEGVEDQATARQLADVGCDIGQGLFFGEPVALPAFLARLDESRH